MLTVAGDGLPPASHLDTCNFNVAINTIASGWVLRGVTSNQRYTTKTKLGELAEKQPSLGRPESTCAALIAIRKKADWWLMPQDERCKIFASESVHATKALAYLPQIAN